MMRYRVCITIYTCTSVSVSLSHAACQHALCPMSLADLTLPRYLIRLLLNRPCGPALDPVCCRPDLTFAVLCTTPTTLLPTERPVRRDRPSTADTTGYVYGIIHIVYHIDVYILCIHIYPSHY